MEFITALFGHDINTYSVARAFYEEYGIVSNVFCKTSRGPCGNSKICRLITDEKMDLDEGFLKAFLPFAQKHSDKKIILMGCGDNYVERIISNREKYPENVIVPYIPKELMEKLITKRDFYEMCEKHGLPYPKTFVYTRDMGKDISLPFSFPIILKPSNGVDYWHNPFATQKKVYKIKDMTELLSVIDDIYTAGYSDALILQDMIDGDDSYMRVMTTFSGKDGKTVFTAMGHPLLEEHTPHGIGNTSFIISCKDEKLSQKIRSFLDEIGYVGFAQFDMKYDERDGEIKIFEANCRQGRNNYYVTGGGTNIAKYLVDEYVYGVKHEYFTADHRSLWSVIPTPVAYMFVKDKKYIPEIKALVRDKKLKNPLFLKGDLSLKRLKYLIRSHLSHYVKYYKYYR